MERKKAEPGTVESLTCCLANKTRVGVWEVRRDRGGYDMKSLTS